MLGASQSPSIEAAPIVTPLAVFAAGRKRFDVIVRSDANFTEAWQIICSEIPLTALGWKRATIKRAGKTQDGWPIWHVEREAQ